MRLDVAGRGHPGTRSAAIGDGAMRKYSFPNVPAEIRPLLRKAEKSVVGSYALGRELGESVGGYMNLLSGADSSFERRLGRLDVLIDSEASDAHVLAWFKREFPAVMACVPDAHLTEFVRGVRENYPKVSMSSSTSPELLPKIYEDTGPERCHTCGKRMDGTNGRHRAIVNGKRSTERCNLCQLSGAAIRPFRPRSA
jgi:hypothetical protein